IIAGASIHYGMDTWNVLDIVQRWDSLFASFFAVLVILMTTISPSGHAQIKIPNEFSAEALSWRINIPATFERAFIPPIRCWICP
ncbi:cytosine permease, partial [Salmonella enterica subsp. enterica serovar Kentucky]|nr:cytosine permease [Salmonella enterica subsp. enterica serovar Kentucky]